MDLGERFVSADYAPASAAGAAGKQIVRGHTVTGLLPVSEKLSGRGVTSRGRVVDLNLAEVSQFGGRYRVVDLSAEEQFSCFWLDH